MTEEEFTDLANKHLVVLERHQLDKNGNKQFDIFGYKKLYKEIRKVCSLPNVKKDVPDVRKANIELYNEDNMTLMARYPDNYFDLAIVDPPYGIGESSNDNKGRSKLAKSKDYGCKNWDDNAPNKEYFKELKRVSKNQIIWGANHFIQNIPEANSSCWIVWNKENGENDFADCELAYASFKTAVRKVDIRWHGMLQHDMKNKEIRIHPTQKPVKLYAWIINKYCKKGFKVLDTHLGSGSIAIACHRYGIDLVGCEIDKEYYDNALKRLKTEQVQQSLF